jgi:uncharacterized protein (UPF0548 family)
LVVDDLRMFRAYDPRRLAAAEFTYPERGATRGELPSGYRHVERRERLGQGEAAFHRASEALFGWRMHAGAGLAVLAAPAKPAAGSLVVMRLGPPLVGAVAPCRIVYVVDEPRRQGFGYGTLLGHPESGEEAFVVEWADDDGVYLTIRAFSRPATLAAKAGDPIVRRIQDVVTNRYVRSLRRLVTPARGSGHAVN